MSRRRMIAALMLGLFAVPSLVAPAWADASVSVELKDAKGAPAEGEVSLYTKAGERVASCTTQAGRCEMSGVPGGMYEARVAPKQGAAPKPHSVMIPPSGTAKLIVSTGS